MTTPPTFTEEDARVMLDIAAAHTLVFNAAAQQYECTIQIDPWSPVVSGVGPRMQDAVWSAVQAVLQATNKGPTRRQRQANKGPTRGR